jgi:hypothetical protein
MGRKVEHSLEKAVGKFRSLVEKMARGSASPLNFSRVNIGKHQIFLEQLCGRNLISRRRSNG